MKITKVLKFENLGKVFICDNIEFEVKLSEDTPVLKEVNHGWYIENRYTLSEILKKDFTLKTENINQFKIDEVFTMENKGKKFNFKGIVFELLEEEGELYLTTPKDENGWSFEIERLFNLTDIINGMFKEIK